MKTLCALVCLFASCAPRPSYGGHCQQQQFILANQSAVFIPQGFIAVPYAVPVAMPSYVQYQANPTPTPAPIVSEPVHAQEAVMR